MMAATQETPAGIGHYKHGHAPDGGRDDKQIKQVEAIIQSMTLEERQHPEIINGRRRQRIARGSGTRVAEINSLLRQFKEMQKMMKGAGKMGKMMGKFMPKLP